MKERKNVILLKVELTRKMRVRFKSQVALTQKSQQYVLGRLIEVWTINQEEKQT